MGKAIAHAVATGSNFFAATPESVQDWVDKIQMLLDATLLGGATEQNSWFMGANVPGKVHAPLFYFGGATAYFDELQNSAENGFPGFETQRARTTQPA